MLSFWCWVNCRNPFSSQPGKEWTPCPKMLDAPDPGCIFPVSCPTSPDRWKSDSNSDFNCLSPNKSRINLEPVGESLKASRSASPLCLLTCIHWGILHAWWISSKISCLLCCLCDTPTHLAGYYSLTSQLCISNISHASHRLLSASLLKLSVPKAFIQLAIFRYMIFQQI